MSKQRFTTTSLDDLINESLSKADQAIKEKADDLKDELVQINNDRNHIIF